MTPEKRRKLHARLQEELEMAMEELSPDTELYFKPMFGGMGIYARGRIFALFVGEDIVLKLSEPDQLELLKKPGSCRLVFGEREIPSRNYIVVPASMRQNPARFAPWLQRSLKYTATLPPPKARRKRA